MIDNYFRSKLPSYTQGLTNLFVRKGITPNQITLAALGISIVASVSIAGGLYTLAVIIWWIGRFLDGMDGILARKTNSATPFGAYLDIVCDMAAYGIMILGFSAAFSHLNWGWLVILFLYILCITSALALGNMEAEKGIDPSDNRGLRLGAGLAEAGETGIAYTLMLLFPSYISFWVVLWIIVLAATVGFRSKLAYQIFKTAQSPKN